ncbi:hypothetical protein [Xenorhabdus bovienii]|uniref:Uncharacterized protein n=1 Tax=Xenorhabdus bovienii str. kraussei Becker Underwood TaxID=1398204 RepID=A0A077PQD0_XENBV|nr:hypothetical protein [Xenorhabdus bovienii]MCG3460772.1 hypothetical protein [Xenorhabdus bovienii]MCG3470106.1 hypothetical protein [Xenorhabdus bovienii]CDG87055.1 hypothetical protein XBFFR1_1490112 [Xenorhabdus bovienii str. feltiae France]CDH26535.1 hypothetical protein XBKB1_780011 [Xenorhabdus bovienii str. kraussei Becker Underwood]
MNLFCSSFALCCQKICDFSCLAEGSVTPEVVERVRRAMSEKDDSTQPDNH